MLTDSTHMIPLTRTDLLATAPSNWPVTACCGRSVGELLAEDNQLSIVVEPESARCRELIDRSNHEAWERAVGLSEQAKIKAFADGHLGSEAYVAGVGQNWALTDPSRPTFTGVCDCPECIEVLHNVAAGTGNGRYYCSTECLEHHDRPEVRSLRHGGFVDGHADPGTPWASLPAGTTIEPREASHRAPEARQGPSRQPFTTYPYPVHDDRPEHRDGGPHTP